jgi:hypothetical protein
MRVLGVGVYPGAGIIACLPAVHAYHNDGLLMCWLVGAIPGVIAGIERFGVAGPPVGLAGPIENGLLYGAVTGLVLGTIGFLVGAGVHRVWHRGRQQTGKPA